MRSKPLNALMAAVLLSAMFQIDVSHVYQIKLGNGETYWATKMGGYQVELPSGQTARIHPNETLCLPASSPQPCTIEYWRESEWQKVPIQPTNQVHLRLKKLVMRKSESFSLLGCGAVIQSSRESKRRRIVLAYPPAGSVWHYPAGISQLAGLLQNDGHEVQQRYGYILGTEHLLLTQDAAQSKLALKTVRQERARINQRYDASQELTRISSEIITPDLFRVERNNVVYVSHHLNQSEGDDLGSVLAAVADREHHLWYEYFLTEELPAAESVDLYGISITDERQLIPGLVLASMVKDAHPEVLVALGGNLWSRVIEPENSQAFARLFALCDVIVYAEGYQPIEVLAETLDPSRAPGSVWIDGDGTVQMNPRPTIPTDFQSLPTPAFETDTRIWAPEPVLPLYTTSNCLHRCSFCAIAAGSDTYLSAPRMMSPRQIAEQMQELSERYGATRFDICDETFPVKRQLALGAELRKIGHQATWQCYLDVMPILADQESCQALYQAGCRAVQLGLETLSPGTLQQERKGWNQPEQYSQILGNLRRAGIQTHVFLIVGIPGEPLHWGLKWLPFLEENGQNILTIKAGRYRLTRQSPEERYGLHSQYIEVLPDTHLLRLNRDFEYRKIEDGRSVRKDVEALRDMVEEACRRHWAYQVSSTLPWWANRGPYSWEELEQMASTLPQASSIHHLDQATSRSRTILNRAGLTCSSNRFDAVRQAAGDI